MQLVGTPSNIITGLPAVTWRNLDSPPYDMANARGGWDLSEGSFPYVDGKSHDNMGRQPIPFSFRFLFINTVQPESFPELFTEWFKAVAIDGTPDKLLHPIIGEVDARVVSWDLELVATRTAGVVLTVEWTDTLLDPEKGQKLKGVPVNVQAAAVACDNQMEQLGISYPTGERTTSFNDMVNQLDSLAYSTRLKVEGMVTQAIGTIDNVIETVDHVEEHGAWALSFNLKQLREGVQHLQEEAEDRFIRRTGLFVTPREMTIDELATELDNLVSEIMGLNPTILALPYVPSRTNVLYFKE